MRLFRILSMVYAFVGLIPGIADAGDWTHWRGPLQTGVAPDTGLPSKLQLDPSQPDCNLIWKAPYGCRSTPLIMNGRVYLINSVGEGATEQERVMCLDANTGKMLWEHKFNVWHTDIVSARLGWTNLAADPKTERIYAHGTQGLLFCFDKNGKIIWQRSLTEEFGRISGYGGRICSPTVVDDLVIIGMLNSSWGDQGKGGNRWVAFDKSDGKVIWWADPAGQPKDTYYCVPVVAVIKGQKLLITGGADGGVYALKVNTGEKAWSYQLGTTMINSAPVVQGNHVFIGHGEENFDTNLQGRIVCLDAGTIENGHPKVVWKVDGIKPRYASPIIDGDRLYYPDDVARLHCLDAKTGKEIWGYSYGINARGSPVLADGKIYVGEVGSKFKILQPGSKKCKELDEQTFFPLSGNADVEINGTPAVANGRLYFSTSEEIYCVGEKKGKSADFPQGTEELRHGEKPMLLQIVPAEVTMHPGDSANFELRLFDEFGNSTSVKGLEADWSLPEPPLPPGANSPPPALKGKIGDGRLTVDAMPPSQQGYVVAKAAGLSAKARVRVAPRLPYSQDFEKVPVGAVPGGWVNTQGKFVVKQAADGNKVLAKVNDKASPLVARGNAYIGLPQYKDYTIECDVQGGKAGNDLPDMGVVANRYTLALAGNIQKLRLNTWDALPRLDRTVPFAWEPGQWYHLKLTFETKNGTGIVRGKCWKKGESEPAEWTVEVSDPRPNAEGAPALYGYVTGIPEGSHGTDIFYDNVRITPNKK